MDSRRRINSYKDLIFWQNAFKVSLLIINIVKILPKDKANDILERQIIRSAVSVGANIAEGFGRYKGKEYERFLQVALGSANETEYWLMVLAETNPRFSIKIKGIMELNSESIKMLAKSLQTLRKSR